MLFESSYSLLRIALAAVTAYIALILLLRLSGKRSLAKLNAFDFVITIALGSALSSFILSKDVTFADGLLALAMLLGLQYVLTRLSIASGMVKWLVRSSPQLLVRDGVIDFDALKRERVTQGEALAAIRKQGIGRIEDVKALVLETDGSFSVVKGQWEDALTAFSDVRGASEAESNDARG